MTITMSELRERVSRQFPNVEQVSNSVVRFTRNAGDRPFAVYYLDIADELPETTEVLTRYQDRVIGNRNFDGRKSLQWSNYLYFLRSQECLGNDKARQAKELIENDRTYARKFVIAESDLDAVLAPHTVAPTEVGQEENVLSIWIDLLTEANLDRAILSDDDLPARLAKIEADSGEDRKASRPPRARSVEPAQFLSSLELRRYRHFPLRRSFNFGTVNLIFGPNASGKTSLLEAIELFFCGRNKRNPDHRLTYELVAVLADGWTQRATSNRHAKEFRDRNLAWYGQSEIKTNYLYRSFAQFNFLDTDAAASLSESTAHIEDDLSKLLVGPDASKIWRDIERVGDAVSARLRDLRPLETQMKTELSRVEKQLTDSASERVQFDSIRARLAQMAARHNWAFDEDAGESAIANFVGFLTELDSLARQAVEIEWAGAPVTHAGLVNYRYAVTGKISEAEPKLARLDKLRKEHDRLGILIARAKEAFECATQLRRFLDAGVADRNSQRRNTENQIATLSSQLASLDPENLQVLSVFDPTAGVAEAEQAAIAKRAGAETNFTATKNEHAQFAKMRDESVNLAQQLRQIANAILERSENRDECPLCHTRFEPGDLARHISMGLDEHLESLGQALLSRLRQEESVLNDARRVESALTWLREFCERANLNTEMTVGAAITHIEDVKDKLAAAGDRLDTLNKEIEELEDAGLSFAALDATLLQLSELGFPLADKSREMAEQLLSTINERASTLVKNREELATEMDDLETWLQGHLNVAGGIKELQRSLFELKERLATTQSILERLDELLVPFPWPDDRAFSELVVASESLRKVALEAHAALAQERHTNALQSELSKRKEELKGQLGTVRQRIERFRNAQTILNKIRKQYSLSTAMQSTLQLNRAAIESIFSSIHAPAEFSGLGSTLATLVRKSDNSVAKLSEISTGQRAAFGLSVFLAQNIQLTVAPPVVLIDDPIAHVDDLNSLSFLDYLREIAIMGRRQIFFSTANDKLATLFERKFDFLGREDFRRFNLARES